MYLKSLILKGFKSFADRSTLEFEPGLAAVVGPNGSGKSNISDAVLWVLGERNAKNLRGQAMEDVIFSGSSARKPVGIAEVELVLNNSDHTLPVDFDEVSIARRMYRNGESEYLINGAIVRRLDVLDILHDSGLGTGTHSIISQGSLDTILQSKPEDRRALIEEAAGVLKHKQRKQKSERKLSQMDAHLTRVQDITNEVERQLKPLERKAKRAQAYQGLADELAQLNLSLAVDELRLIKDKWSKSVELEKSLSNQLKEINLKIEVVDQEMQQLQEEVQERNVNANDIAKDSRRAQAILERLDSTSLLVLEKERSAINYQTEIRLTLEENAAKSKAAASRIKQNADQADEVVTEREEAQKRLDELELEQQKLSQASSDLDTSLDTLGRKEQELRREIEVVSAAKTKNLETLSSSRAHEKLIASHRVELESRLSQARNDVEKSQLQCSELETRFEKLQAEEKEARLAVSECFTRRESTRTAYEQLRDESSSSAAEIKGLEEMERLSETSSPALSWLLEHKEEFDKEITFLSHVVQAPQELDALVESLLGVDLNALIVSDIAHANAIAEALCARDDSGEVVLLSRMQKAHRISDQTKYSGLGVSLISQLSFEEQYRDVVESVLGDVYICHSIQDALQAHAQSSGDTRFATREGFLIWGNSKISMSFNRSNDEGVLARHRRLEELRNTLAQQKQKLASYESLQEENDKELSAAQSKSLQCAQESAQMQGSLHAAKEEYKRANEKLDALKHELDDLELQENEAKRVLEQAQPESVELENRLANLVEQLEHTKTAIQNNTFELKPLRERKNALNEQLSSIRLQVATLRERENYAKRMLESAQNEEASLVKERKTSLDVLVRKGLVKKRVTPLLAVLEKLSSSIKATSEELEKGALQAQDSTSGLNASMQDARQRSRKAHDEANRINDVLSEARVEKGRLELQVESAVKSIVHECNTPLETALALPELEDRKTVEENAFKLRRKIANMGTINPDAAFEYEELKTRYNYLATQLEDMRYARRALSKIIRVIDTRMKGAFVETFEQVNENFKEIFAVLFPGGSAELLLSDVDDLETTGVEVTAQPRGKRITKMMLMSGGEKSLTALALLFAVYRIRATPFYILDEVEAALDDSNLRRLCSYFVSLRDSTQLILITHQRRTMEIADVLYGVSMQADGVTRVVGQKLDQALKQSEG
ncbi:MAG: chromosome segregation protein SMC [Raoultibacter sp.]